MVMVGWLEKTDNHKVVSVYMCMLFGQASTYIPSVGWYKESYGYAYTCQHISTCACYMTDGRCLTIMPHHDSMKDGAQSR